MFWVKASTTLGVVVGWIVIGLLCIPSILIIVGIVWFVVSVVRGVVNNK